MVAGNFKNKIAGMGNGCKLSVPTVITAKTIRFIPGATTPRSTPLSCWRPSPPSSQLKSRPGLARAPPG